MDLLHEPFMPMRIRLYGTKPIAQYGRSRAPDATGRHRAGFRPPVRLSKLAFKRHKKKPLFSSLK